MNVLAHGGAGRPPSDPATAESSLETAVAAGRDRETPLAAVRETVHHLESAPSFNAGVGSAVQSDGVIRTDAGVMAGDGTCGAACAMPGVEHALEVAHLVATETPHVLLAGDRAVALASARGVETDRNLWTAETRKRWDDASPPEGDDPADHLAWVRERFGGSDTVGAVASDGDRVAAATSTGGRWFALAGRVGDVPQVGAGFYATERAAASATGAGEAIARYGLARRAVEAVEDGDDPGTAADRVIRGFGAETGAAAGVILVDDRGRTGRSHDAEAMPTAGTGSTD